MKKKNLLIISGLALALGTGALIATSNGKTPLPVVAYSSNYVNIYVEAFEGYDSSAVYMSYKDQSNGNETLITMSSSLGNHKYLFQVPEDIGSFQVFRGKNSSDEGYDPSNGGANWKNGWNYTGYIDFDSGKNYCKITNWEFSYDYYNVYVNDLNAGEKLYMTIDQNDYDWFAGDAHFNFFLWDDISGSTKIIDASLAVANTTTIVGTLDSDFACNGFLAVRVAPGKTFDGSDWENSVVWNQTSNVTFTSENQGCRASISRTVTGNYNAIDGFEPISASFFAKAFSYYFLEETSDYCTVDQANKQTALKTAFDAFENLQTGTKAAFYSGETDHTADGWRNDDNKRVDATKEARSRYWHMTYQRGYDDFLGVKSLVAQAVQTPTYAYKNDFSPIAAIAGCITLSSVMAGGYFLLRRRKEN